MVASIKPHRDEIGLTDGLLLIDGQWVAAQGGETWSHSHPATGEEVASFPIAGPADVDAAVRAARRAFDDGPWPRARAGERIRVLRRIADLVREHGDELLALQALDNSVPLSFGSVYAMSAGFVADVFDHHAGWVDKLAGETLPPYQGGDHLVMTLREPVGVVGAVIPWNAPLLLFAQKLAPALAAGLHHRAQAVGVRDVRGAAAGRADRGGRAAARGAQRRHRPGRADRRRADQPPDGRQAVVHRQPGRRPQDRRGVGGRVQAGQPGAGRQEPGAGVRRRGRVHGRGDHHGHGHPRPVRAGLPGADPGAGAPGRGRRVPGHGRDDRRDGQLRQPVRPGRHLVAADQHPAAGPGARADRRGPGRRAPGWSAAAPAARATWPRATSSRRRCSPTCPTT